MARQWGNKNWGEQNSFLYLFFKFPRSSEGKESACDAGDLGLIRGSGRSPGEGSDNRLQYSCLESPMNRGAWRATALGSQRHD